MKKVLDGMIRRLVRKGQHTSRDHWLAGSRARVKLQAVAVSTSVALIKSLLAWGHSGEFCLDLQGIFQMLVNFHYSSLVTASVAVVWCCKVVATLVKYPA